MTWFFQPQNERGRHLPAPAVESIGKRAGSKTPPGKRKLKRRAKRAAQRARRSA